MEDRLAPATLTVNTLADSTGGSQLSLRAAILAVNAGSYSGSATGQVSGTFGSNDTILFQSGLTGTISLTTANGPLVISSNLTLTANPTLNAITVSGQFAGSQTGVFQVTSAGTATVAGLTITKGKDSTNLFGAIHVQSGGALTVNGCTFVNNQSMGAGGGAILNAGTLTVTNSTFKDNSGVVGGAIDNISGATATLINCTISGNQATSGSGSGGGVANAGTLTLLNTLIAQNTSAGTNPDVVGAFTSSGHNLIGNATGATGLTDGINGDQVGSAAPFTGDVTSGLATITNVSSTAGLAVGQLVTDTAGAIPAGTVIAVLGPHTITLSQVATSSQTGDTFTSSVYANLGPLRNNGGGIQTMALLPLSPAIDAGANSDAVLTVPAADQRGVSRPQAGTVDIGAFEANQLLVTNLNDSGAGSLRDALTQSNSIPGTVLIDFQAGLTGTIELTTARLEIIHDNWVRGPGASQITVDGNLNFWCFGVNSQYQSIGDLHTAISGLTLTRGKQTQGLSDSRGGAISYRGGFPNTYHLTVKDCVIEDSGDDGIYAEDRLSVINTRIFNSTGHGININSDDLDVSNSWIAGNSEHGISAGDTVLTNCTLSGNGENGIRNGDGNQLLTNCTVTGNKKGVEVSFEDIGLYTNCTIMGNIEEDARTVVGNSGGNMIFRNSIVGKMVVQFGIFTSQGNNIFVGGFPGTLQSSDVVCPVISSLSAASGGTLPSGKHYYVIGAVTATGTLTSLESSITVGANSKVTINWTAPVGISGVTGYKIYRGTTLGGETLIATVSAGTTSFTDTGAAGSSSVSLLLGALANNGGPVPTLAPTANGSVFTSNKANSAFAPLLDQCGYLRNPILPGIGAVESVSSTPNTVSLSPGTLVGIDQGLSYSQAITASGGTGTGYLIGITAGALPPGFTLTLDGTLAGTATTLGSFAFTVTGFDSAGNFGSKNYTLDVNPAPSITTSSLPMATENVAYSKAILTSGGTAPFTWSSTGTLPSGITFDTATGTFGGTPDAGSAGTYNNIQVTATDLYGKSATQTFSLTIHPFIGLSIGTSAVAYTENAVVLLSDAATVSNLDPAHLPDGKLTVQLASGGSSDDRLGIRNEGDAPGQVGVSSTTVKFGGVAVGTFTGGVGTTPLVVTFNASATPAAVQAVARNITFAVVSENPTTTNREVEWTLTDGDGGTSTTVGQTVTVTAVNDAPVIGGAVADQPVNDNATIAPFASLTVIDPDNETSTASVTIQNGANRGDFTAASAVAWTRAVIGADIVYTRSFAGANVGAAVQAGLRALVFAPRANAIVPGSTEKTLFSISVDDSGPPISNGSEISVVATSLNDAPSGQPSRYVARMNRRLRVALANGLLRGAIDPDVGAVLTARLVGRVKGVLRLNPDGSFTYTPRLGFRGTVKFLFMIDDGQGASSGPITVTIKVR